MTKLDWILAAASLLAVPATAQIVFSDSPPAAPPTKPAATKSDADKVVCRSQETLGSRLQAHQVCLTKQQWSQYELEEKQKVHDIQDIGRAQQGTQ
ncbi:MAG TPA: hypothetical protein VE820_13655 [Sphingomicrobium sp.]|nr:hypothetical protein [Sphingomicrobium sp.]